MKTFPLCAKCQVSYGPLVNAVYVLEMAGERPYKLWHADSYVCPKCGHVIIGGFGARAHEHFEAHFAQRVISAFEAGRLFVELESVPVTLSEVMEELYAQVNNES